MRLSVPSCSPFLAAIGLATSLSLTSLSAVSAVHDHEHSPLPAAAADAAQARQQATDHTRALMAFQKEWTNAQGAAKSRALEKLIAKAEERQAFLAELVKTNPAEVLRVAIPDEQQEHMPAEVLQFVEQKLELEGELQVVYEDYADGSHKLRQFLKTPFGERFELHFAAKQPQLASGTSVRAYGLLLEGEAADANAQDGRLALASAEQSLETLAADGGESEGGASGTAAALPSTFGEQRTLVLLVNFRDQPNNHPWTTAEINDTVFSEVSNFYLENSSGQSWLAGTTEGWYTLPIDSTSCDYWAISSEANKAAEAAGVTLANYDRYVYVFPRNACGWGGLGTIGGSKTYSWINGKPTLNYIGHELGHNFGLYHSHALDCTEGTLEGTCYSLNYGDTLDVMGNPNAGHFNAFQKDQLGWFNAGSAASILAIETSGSYDIGTYEFPDAGSPAALKILKDVDSETGRKSWYYVEMRQAEGFDSFLSGNGNVQNGLVIHSGKDADRDSSHLLDMTPNSSTWYDMNDPALTIGQSFSDPAAGIILSTQWVDSSGGTLDVYLGSQTCSPQPPALVLEAAESDWVASGTSVDYSLTLSNKNGSACSDTLYELSTAIPGDWSAVFDRSSITLAPGNSTTLYLTVTSAPDAADGFYDIDITAASASGSNTVTATYVVSPPDANNAPTANDDSAITKAGIAVSIDVLANDSDPDGDSLKVAAWTQGSSGTVSLDAGVLSYTPNSGFAGTDGFSYSIDDGRGGSASASVQVTVEAPVTNQPPVTIDDNATTLENTAVSIAVLANDWDPDNDTLDIAAVSSAANGQVRINADGTLTYTPDKRFKGSDSFSYDLTDGTHTVKGMVTVTVEKSTVNGGGSAKGGGKPAK